MNNEQVVLLYVHSGLGHRVPHKSYLPAKLGKNVRNSLLLYGYCGFRNAIK